MGLYDSNLGELIQKVAEYCGISLDSMPSHAPFGGPEIFRILDVLESQGSIFWTSMRIDHEGELDFDDFELSDTGDIAITFRLIFKHLEKENILLVISPREEIGVLFSKMPINQIKFCFQEKLSKKHFNDNLDFESSGNLDSDHLRYLRQWRNLRYCQ